MVSAADVPPGELIAAVKEDLKKSIKMPEWARFVKTGAGRLRPPEQEDWWWTRAAAILRQVYLHGPVGVSRLRTTFGNRKDRGVKPERTYKAGGKIIREILKQLEGLGYIKKGKKGREITSQGQSYLDKKVPGFGRKPEVKEEPKEERVEVPKEKKPEPKKEEKKPEAKKVEKAPEPKKAAAPKKKVKEAPKKREAAPKKAAKPKKKAKTETPKKKAAKKVKGAGKSR